MPIWSEKAGLYAYRKKGAESICTEIFQAKGPATTSLRQSMEYGSTVYWKDEQHRIRKAAFGDTEGDPTDEAVDNHWHSLTYKERMEEIKSYAKHNYELVQFVLRELPK